MVEVKKEAFFTSTFGYNDFLEHHKVNRRGRLIAPIADSSAFNGYSDTQMKK